MSQIDTLDDLYEKLKSSPHRREDIRIEKVKMRLEHPLAK